MRLPVPGPRDLMSALERGSEQVEALLGAVPRALALLDRAEVLIERASATVDRVGGVVDAATAEVARVGAVVDAATVQVERVGTVVAAAATEIDRVTTVVDGAAVQAGRAGGLLDAVEPSLTKLQPTLKTLADTTHPDEVAALVRLVDHLPALTDQVERDVLPVLTTLGSVAPDLHELLNVSRELNEILGKIPGIGRLKKRVEEDDDIETPRAPQGNPS
jgi:ABC-type transporter Mla subunit MlaD